MPFWLHFYLSPSGRTGRLLYWVMGVIPLALLGFACGTLLPRTQGATRYWRIAVILLFWPQVVILARRLHDINLAGWWITLGWGLPVALVLLHAPLPVEAVIVVQWLATVVLGLIPGTRGPNQYGNDPQGNTRMVRPNPS